MNVRMLPRLKEENREVKHNTADRLRSQLAFDARKS
jgi:hypothetical protein